jgi:hypothetical protein
MVDFRFNYIIKEIQKVLEILCNIDQPRVICATPGESENVISAVALMEQGKQKRCRSV